MRKRLAAFAAALTAASAVAGGAEGFWKDKESRFLSARFSGDMRDTIYAEAVNAFRSHDDDKGWWQGEYWGKHMLGAVAAWSISADDGLKTWIEKNAHAFVREFQRPDGYIGTCSDPLDTGPNSDGSEKFNWNIWGRKYTVWALLEIHSMSGDRFFLDAASRLMDQTIAQLKRPEGPSIDRTGYFAGLPSMSILKPLMILYRATGRKEYLDFASGIVAKWDCDGNPVPNLVRNAFSGRPVHEWYPNPGHWAKAYEMMSCLEGVLDYAEVVEGARKARLTDAVLRIERQLLAHESNPMGSVGYFDHFTGARACPNAITELCDVVYFMRLERALYAATGDGRHIDAMEAAFLNGFLPGVFRDGKWAAHGVRSHGTRHFPAPHQVGMKYHHCCVDNAARAWKDVSEAAVSIGDGGSVEVALLFAGRYTLRDGGEDVVVRIAGDYPFGGEISISAVSAKSRKIVVRRPGWARAFAVECVGNVAHVRLEGEVSVNSWRVADDADVRTRLFEQLESTPEMAGLSRRGAGTYVTFGPLLLAKSTLCGTPRKSVLAERVSGQSGWTCRLEPMTPKATHRAWKATFSKGGESFTVDVCDFASCDVDDSSAAFSIWM